MTRDVTKDLSEQDYWWCGNWWNAGIRRSGTRHRGGECGGPDPGDFRDGATVPAASATTRASRTAGTVDAGAATPTADVGAATATSATGPVDARPTAATPLVR